MSLICVAEEEVSFYLSHRAPLGHREVADLEEDVDGELVLKGDCVRGACAVEGISMAPEAAKVLFLRQLLKEVI